MRWWLRSVAVGFAVGFGVGLVVGGTLGRVFMLGQIVRGNSEDFERLAPDRKRSPGRAAQGVVLLGMTGFAVFAVTGVVLAYTAV